MHVWLITCGRVHAVRMQVGGHGVVEAVQERVGVQPSWLGEVVAHRYCQYVIPCNQMPMAVCGIQDVGTASVLMSAA